MGRCVSLSDPPWKDDNFRLTMVRSKALSDEDKLNSIDLNFLHLFTIVGSLQKLNAHFYCRKTYRNYLI